MDTSDTVPDNNFLPLISCYLTIVATTITAWFSRERTFSAVIDRFRAEEMPDRYSTRNSYESMLKKWIEPRWGNIPVTAITSIDIEHWLRDMSCSPKTRVSTGKPCCISCSPRRSAGRW